MDRRRRWTYGQATFSASCRQGVIRAELSGPLTEAALAYFCGAVGPQLRDHGAGYVLLIRMEHATVECSAEAMTTATVDPLSELEMPGAVVCRPEDYPVLRQHCQLAAEHGYLRRAFTSVGEALAWARERAATAREAKLLGKGRR